MTTVLQFLLSRPGLRNVSRWATTIAIVLVIFGGAYFLYARFSIPQVILTEVVNGPVVQAFYATGTLLPEREYPVKSNVEGTIDEVPVDKGTVVRKGQKLAHVYVEEFHLKQKQAEADLELKQKMADTKTSPVLLELDAKIRAAEQQLEIARREYNRLAQLRDTGGRTLSELDRADEAVKTLVNTAQALTQARATKRLEFERDVKFTQAALDIAKWNVEQQTIASPLDGVVLDWPVTIGTRVKVNDLLLNVADVRYEKLVMRVNVDEEDITRVKLDQTAQVSLYSYAQRVFLGRVHKIYPKADPSRRTFEVDVRIEQPDPDFAAGMTGELAFVVDSRENAVVVPSQAIQQGKLWSVRERQLVALDVKLGLRSIQRTEVLSGVAAKEFVVVSPIGHLKSLQEVRTTYMDPIIAAGLNEPKKDSTGFSKF